jgi:hypothetical protein
MILVEQTDDIQAYMWGRPADLLHMQMTVNFDLILESLISFPNQYSGEVYFVLALIPGAFCVGDTVNTARFPLCFFAIP